GERAVGGGLRSAGGGVGVGHLLGWFRGQTTKGSRLVGRSGYHGPLGDATPPLTQARQRSILDRGADCAPEGPTVASARVDHLRRPRGHRALPALRRAGTTRRPPAGG